MKFCVVKKINAMILVVLLFLSMSLQLSNAASADTSDIRVVLDGLQIRFDVPPQVISGRTMVPMRAVFEELGARVEWNPSTQTIIATTDSGDTLRLVIGSNTIYKNNIADVIDVPAQVINGRTMVPMRFIAQAMGLDVRWIESTRTVEIETPIDVTAFEQRVFELINLERENRGYHTLIWDDDLANVARNHSVDMAVNNLSSTIGSDGSTTYDRLERAGVTMRSGGQIMVFNQRTPEAAAEQLIRNNLHSVLHENNTHIGVGFHRKPDSQHRFYTNINFGEDRATLRLLWNYPPLSEITIPNRRLTTDEMSTWISEYHVMGSSNHFEIEVVELVNKERANAGLRPLSINSTLMMTARFKSQSMSDLNYFDHTGVYGEPWDLARVFGYNFRAFGENLARSQTSAASVVDTWMNSPGHRSNILNSGFNSIGVGLYICDDFRFNWTQMFSS